jgi:MoaA/NifB/PqqE/SkfB family radical SAM enzyme
MSERLQVNGIEMPQEHRPLPILARIPRAEVDMPVLQNELTADTANIYALTLCGGAGTVEDPRLCEYCFLSTQQLKSDNMMDMGTFDEILDWLSDDSSPVTTLSLLGGEFPYNPNAKAMVQRGHERGFNLHIVTNGSHEFGELISDPDVHEIMKDPERDNLVAVSMDSPLSAVNDRYRGRGATVNALETIGLLSRRWGLDIPFRINTTVMRPAMKDLPLLYRYAEDIGAMAVLVHFPSSVGRGKGIFKRHLEMQYAEDGISHNEVPDLVEWTNIVVKGVAEYLRDHRRRADFTVSCERGYMFAGTSRREMTRCDLADKSASLQFAPRISAENPDIPVVSCGLNMAQANTYSGYILRDGTMYKRAGKSELRDARWGNSAACPMTLGQRPDRYTSCIYSRVQEGEVSAI